MNCKSLYVHIPFCVSRCDYCDFFSSECKTSIPDYYIDALLSELKFYVWRYKIDCFKTIYIGGGTPSLLSAFQLEKLITSLKTLVPIKDVKELTVEMNPETVDQDKLFVLQNVGCTRLSLGIQSFFDGALKAVNRHCSADKAKKTLELVKKVWSKDLNLDCIAGLPGQTTKEFCTSLEEICSYKPEHISLYTLTVEEGTVLFNKIENGMEWDINEADNQWLLGRDILFKKDFVQYEVSNFSLKNHESIHNMAYWQQEDYIGIGSGATSSVYNFTEKTFGLRWTNNYDIDQYCKFWNEANSFYLNSLGKDFSFEKTIPRQTEELCLKTQEFEFLMMGLRTLKGISSDCYKKRFSLVSPWHGDLQKRLGVKDGVWQKFTCKGMCKSYVAQDGCVWYATTDKGILFLNSLLGYLT